MELFSIRIRRTFQLVSTYDTKNDIKYYYSNGYIYDSNRNIIGNYNNGFVKFKTTKQ